MAERALILGLVFGIVSVIVLLIIATVPIENLVHVRPPLRSYTISPLYLYSWRLAALSFITLLLTLAVAYVTGGGKFYTGVLIVQSIFFVIAHYAYLYIVSMYSKFSIGPLLYYVNGVPHVDLGQITLIVLLVYAVCKITRSSGRVQNREACRTCKLSRKS